MCPPPYKARVSWPRMAFVRRWFTFWAMAVTNGARARMRSTNCRSRAI